MISTFEEFEDYLSRFTNYERVRAYPADRRMLGLERMSGLAEALGRPDRRCPSIHIAGTKGKGSTSMILEQLLRVAGRSVGAYLSPHVEHLRERIRLDGAPISEAGLVRLARDIEPVVEALKRLDPDASPSFFELMTALAMSAFGARPVDWAIFEVGLGGRLDATNIIEPRWTAITSIALEHTQLLGDTVAKIAGEKAGIVKPGTPVIVGHLPPAALAVVEEIARSRGAPLILADIESVRPQGPDRLCVGPFEDVPAGRVLGPGLRADLALAVEIFGRVCASAGEPLKRETLVAALGALELPARIEIFPGAPPVVIDAAHTVESVRSLRAALEEVRFPRPRTLVASLSSDKQEAAILEEMELLAEEVIWTLADATRSLPPEQLQRSSGQGEVFRCPQKAFDEALRRGHPIVVTGSFYLAGKLRGRCGARALTAGSPGR